VYKCKKCELEFLTITSFVSHLSHPKSKCKTNIKEYYDEFLRKENEGICQFCGRETAFASIERGYINNTCKHCRNNKLDSKSKRRNNCNQKREIKKIETGYYNLKEQCQLCSKDVRFKTREGLSKHISQIHKNISSEEYYNQFIKTNPLEGICKISGEKTSFINLCEGYCTYKFSGSNSKDEEVKKKKEETLFKNYQVLNPCYANSEKRKDTYLKTMEKKLQMKNVRIRLISLLKKLTINKNNKKQCQLCGDVFKNYISISRHLRIHNITSKEYYDKFFKSLSEDICPISNLETSFDSIERGYFKYHKLFITYSDEIKNGGKKNQLEYIKNKIKSLQKEYNVEFLDVNNINLIGDITSIKCLECNNIYQNRFTNLVTGYGKCPKCFPRNKHVSDQEKELRLEVEKIVGKENVIPSNFEIIKNPDTGRKLELDMYIPSKKYAIEFNGLYWHSEMILNEKAITCHVMKLNECKKIGIDLFQIFEDEWILKKDIIVSMLKHKLGSNDNPKIYARKCKIKEINQTFKNNFLEENHIQGRDTSRVKLGAFYNDELVSVMTFGIGNISKGGNPNDLEKWELNRFCSKKEYLVIGIAGKLLKYFKENYKWQEIYSYADLRFSSGDIYKKLGFELVKQNPPNYFYVKGLKRFHRYGLRKLPTESRDIPEWRLRMDQGYFRIWDCGTLKFSITK